VDDNASMALAELPYKIKDVHVGRRVRLRGIVACRPSHREWSPSATRTARSPSRGWVLRPPPTGPGRRATWQEKGPVPTGSTSTVQAQAVELEDTRPFGSC